MRGWEGPSVEDIRGMAKEDLSGINFIAGIKKEVTKLEAIKKKVVKNFVQSKQRVLVHNA